MAGIDQDDLAAAVAHWYVPEIRILDPGPHTRAVIPETWWPVAESTDPQERAGAARALWNADLLALLPRYAHALRTALIDVRVAEQRHLSTPALYYVLRGDDDERHVWAGADPRSFGDREPPLFDTLPASVRMFLRQVHAGYTTLDDESCGLAAPSSMTTLAARWGAPDRNTILEWEEDTAFPGTQRLLFVTGDGDDIALYVSPDLPAGTAVTYFEPDFEIQPFGPTLDDFISRPLWC